MPFKIQEIVFILPVIPFQTSWCLRLVGEYEPVIPFQIYDTYSLKDEKWERRVPCHYLSNSWCLQGDSQRDSNNISCAKSGCQCCRERAKSREAVIVAASFRGRVRQGKTDSFTDMFLHKTKVECEINM